MHYRESMGKVLETYDMVMDIIEQRQLRSVIVPIQYCLGHKVRMDQYIDQCLKGILDKTRMSKWLKDVYLIETLDWEYLNEWVETHYVEEQQLNMNTLWMDTYEDQMRKGFQQLMRAIKIDIIRKR